MRITLAPLLYLLAASCSVSTPTVPAMEEDPPVETATNCETSATVTAVTLALGFDVPPGEEKNMCLRWTATETLDINAFEGNMGAGGHHALLFSVANSKFPDGVAPCSEAEIMDAKTNGAFSMVAGISYESDGKRFDFPAVPVQIGLRVPKGSQLIFDAHMVNPNEKIMHACAKMELQRSKPVVAALEFRTVLPPAQYELEIPAHSSLDVTYSEVSGSSYRIVAASSHMHEGGTHFRMSVVENDVTLYETGEWHDPVPKIYDTQKILVGPTDHFLLDCSFTNDGDATQWFPDQMCVGGMYLLSCDLPGAC